MMKEPNKETLIYLEKIAPFIKKEDFEVGKGRIITFKKNIPKEILELLEGIKENLDINIIRYSVSEV